MTRADPRFLALLVHRGLLQPADAQRALASGDPGADLIGRGVVTEAQWRDWLETDAGARPRLTRYRLDQQLGEGGQARVFRATDLKDGQVVALKVLKPELATKPETVAGFVAEARLLIDLRHEHIVRGLRVAKEGDVYFYAMELIDGVCLQDRLSDGERLDEDTALRVVAQVAGALMYLHERGLVHRDVKPGNILWTERGRAVLIDLGFAVDRSGAGGGESTAGTVHYISPEQARGQGELDVRADIYSLGATLYHMTTGSLPFAGETSQEVLARQVLDALSGEEIRALGLSPQMHYFIEKMMAKEKEIRFQSPEQLVAEVSAYLAQRDAEREIDGEPERKGFRRDATRRRRPRRRR